MNRRRNISGFSLIELLVVIGLIAILSSLLLIGISKLQTNSRRQQTRLVFQNLTAMYSEWDAANRHHFINYSDVNTGVYNVDVAAPCPGNVANIPPSMGPYDPEGRDGFAVLATRDVLALLKQMPTNTAAMGKLSPATFTTLPAAPQPASSWTSGTTYSIFSRVYAQGPPNSFGVKPNFFYTAVAIGWDATNPQLPQPAPPNERFWLASSADATVPVLVDGWGNPIIFVPGGILGYDQGAASGKVTAGGISGTQVKSPDGRPFWASAGPDGDFSKGDDNLYSFEK